MDIPESGPMRLLYDEHAAALWRYAFRLTGDQIRAQDVVQQALLRAQQHPEVLDDTELSARAWLFTQARNMVGDDRHGAGLVSSNGSGALQPAGRTERNSALDRMLVGDGIAQLCSEHRAVLRRSYYQGWTTAHIAADLGIGEDTVKLWLHQALRTLRQSLVEMGVAQ
jgi:RNA polymerase sigma-70 factor (ECF subfamily)